MLIITLLYVGMIWLVFFRLRLLPWNWPWRIATVVAGLAILATFLGLLNYLTPSGRVAVAGRVVEVTPNIAGQVIAIEVEPDVPVKQGDVLFRIDPAPFEAKVRQLKAGLVDAQQRARRLAADLDQARAEVKRVEGQLAYAERRRTDLESLVRTNSTSEFRLQDAASQVDTLAAQLVSAKAREASTQLALDSEIEGENTGVAQLRAQLDNAEWELAQTMVRARANGFVSNLSLATGDRTTPFKAAMSFVRSDEITLLALFPQNGMQTVREGVPVKLAFASVPGRVYDTSVDSVIGAVGEGQVGVSGTLARTTALPPTEYYPVRIRIPPDIDPAAMRLGMAGTVTAISLNAGPIGLIATILMHVKALALYI